ncbi:MAG: DMT family transporter [Thermomonas sp.]|uniref:DMT family transporter n=1 Tax=Thermomonas sp. TaxID=1971895 RepID=UPI001EB5D67F|nr:DMT family transporter [Thermomonas sp.]MBV2208298.1 DMT family transporter [Thermomonas sp.]
MSHAPTQKAASLELLAGAAIIGSNGLMVRMAEMPPTAVAFWRMLLAGLMLAVLVSVRHGWQRFSGKTWLWLLVPMAAFSVDLWMWHKSILLVGPGLSTLLANAQVFFMAIAGVLLFGERLSGRFLLGVLLAFLGLWLLLGEDWGGLPKQYRWGVWLGLAAGLMYATYNVGIKRSQALAGEGRARVPVEQVLCFAAFGSALGLGLLGWAEGEVFTPPSLHAWGILLALAAFGHCLSWVLISRSMVVLPVALTGLLLLAQPIVAYLLDVLVLQIQIPPRQWLGLAVSLAGIFVAGMRTRQERVAQEA